VNVRQGYSHKFTQIKYLCVFVVIFWHDSLNVLIYKHAELPNKYALSINVADS
jgi:sRNA-binding regulator protein Hfq